MSPSSARLTSSNHARPVAVPFRPRSRPDPVLGGGRDEGRLDARPVPRAADGGGVVREGEGRHRERRRHRGGVACERIGRRRPRPDPGREAVDVADLQRHLLRHDGERSRRVRAELDRRRCRRGRPPRDAPRPRTGPGRRATSPREGPRGRRPRSRRSRPATGWSVVAGARGAAAAGRAATSAAQRRSSERIGGFCHPEGLRQPGPEGSAVGSSPVVAPVLTRPVLSV